MTSNEEREFPPAFLRRCLRLDLGQPTRDELNDIVEAHFDNEPEILAKVKDIIDTFETKRKQAELATDQLLNAIYLLKGDRLKDDKEKLIERLLRSLEN
jgi:MoxR-like ATPase